MPRKKHKLPPKPSLERIQAMLARRRWDYVPPEPSQAPPPLPESAGDVHRRAIGLPPADGRPSIGGAQDATISSSRADTPIPGTERPRHYLDDQNRILATIEGFQTGGFQNRPTERDRQAAANRERIIKKFHGMQYAGELLPSGKIWYDCVEYTPEGWERRMRSEGR